MTMDAPPKITDVPARLAPLEVISPAQPHFASAPDNRPIHALSALVLVAVDSLWAVFEFTPPLWIVMIPACFAAVFIPTYLIQRHLKNDSPSRAVTFATLLGV